MLRKIPGTALSWTTMRDWLALVYAVCGPIRARSREHARRERLCRSLTIANIRACLDVETLEEAADLFDRSRYNNAHLHHGPFHSLTRAECAERMVECHNQAHRIRSGAAFRERMPGPRFDPARTPMRALDRLLQTHPDLAVVEALRTEKRRRFEHRAQPSPMAA
ncbi:hypothetical protein FBY14_1101 [Azospirillum brasilense]|nr:hypothetical protein FBY14_1101 [Azospirillum brasilense]